MTEKKMISYFTGFVCFLLMVVFLSFSTAQAEAPVTIEYWHINSATFGGQAIKQIVECFHEIEPNIEVLERFQEGSYGGVLNNLQAALVAGNPPAVAQIGYNFRQFAFSELPHKPIEDFKTVDVEYNEVLDRFIDGIVGLGQDEEGIQRAIPLAISVPLLYYNADLFRKAGLDPNDPPKTWEQVRAASLAIKEKTDEYGLGIQISNSNNWLPQSMVESNGGWFLNPEGKVEVYSPKVIEIYKFWQEMAIKDCSLPVVTDAEQQQAFVGGRLGMYIKTSAALTNFVEQANFDLRTAQFPSWGNKPRRLASGGNVLFIFAIDEQKQEAAYKFIKFLSSKEAQTLWVKGTGYLPLVKGVEDDPNYLKSFFSDNPLTAPAREELPYAVPWLPFPGPRGFEAEQILIEARQSILDGESVEKTLQNADRDLKLMLGQ